MSWTLPIGAQVTPDGVRFRVWAPDARQVQVVLFDGGNRSASHDLERADDGFWSGSVPGIGAVARYAFSVDGGDPRPDPASRSQPNGVHAPSAVVDPAEFRWTDDDWRGVPLKDFVIYEAHVGTATEAGSFEALIERLPYLVDLGVTAVEIMPIADFPGCRNWGYDGVSLYAPANCYGGPQGFKQLVDAAHGLGIAVILDVVYNHFGPDGNYLRDFSKQYFTGRHHTPWGEALNLDDEHAEPVRRFLVDNALYWAHEYHVDGLRLDATHALIDDSANHLLRELTTSVHESLPADRHFVIMAEDERNDQRLGLPADQGGYGLDAIWADDFHHEARIALTGEQTGYYADYSGSLADLATTVRDGWFYQGQASKVNQHNRGTAPRELALPQFVYCIQNHDQIGNRPLGDRLSHVVDPAAYRALSALLLLLPQTPMLFQGQEWAASTPFLFFTDHNAELGKLVTEGRRKEFKGFWEKTHMEVPDPQAEETYQRSKLHWAEADTKPHSQVLMLYRDLLALRRSDPALRNTDRAAFEVAVLRGATGERSDETADGALVLRRRDASLERELLIVVNLHGSFRARLSALHAAFGDQQAQAVNTSTPTPAVPSLILDTNAERYGGSRPARLGAGNGNELLLDLPEPGIVVLGSRT